MIDAMTQPQAGWYPDPADSARQRYWAGDAWTAETRQLETPPPTPDPYASYAASATPTTSYAYPTPTGVTYANPAYAQGPVTADGVPLSGWWWRVLATVLDSLVLGVINMIIMPMVPGLLSGVQTWLNDLMDAVYAGSLNPPMPTDPAYGLEKAFMIYLVINLVIACVYAIVMLRFAGRTLGQMACGLRVVPVDQGQHTGGLPMGTVLARVAMYTLLPQCLSVFSMFLSFSSGLTSGLSSLLTFLGSGYTIVNALWALWDVKNQCLHDKVARTQVVRPIGR